MNEEELIDKIAHIIVSALITDEMVEAAAVVLRNQLRERVGLSPLDRLPWSPASDEVRGDARAALEAVAPLIAAKAWDEGYAEGGRGRMWDSINPYDTSDGAERIETGRKKVGAILGDYVEVGCNSVLNPGTVIGRHSNIYPVSCVRGVIPADSILKSSGEVVHKK